MATADCELILGPREAIPVSRGPVCNQMHIYAKG